MNIRFAILQILFVLSITSYAHSERKRQLMSDSEIIASIDENISLMLKFARIIVAKKSEQARKKCTIALKNLKTLSSATENGNIQMNPITNITLNGLIWHSDPCIKPDQIIKHIELYNLIKLNKLFSQLSNLKHSNSSNIKRSDADAPITKSYFLTLNQLKNTAFRSTGASKSPKDHQTTSNLVLKRTNFGVTNLLGDDENSKGTTSNLNTTIALNPCEQFDLKVNNNTRDSDNSAKKQINLELEQLAKLKSVSSKSSSGFSEALCRILSERGAQ